jgi:hypothetical protein
VGFTPTEALRGRRRDVLPPKNGSERESEKSMISRGFPQDEKFGFQGCHSLGFQ